MDLSTTVLMCTDQEGCIAHLKAEQADWERWDRIASQNDD